MKVLILLLISFLQNPDSEYRPAAVSTASDTTPAGLRAEKISLGQLRQMNSDGSWIPVPRSVLRELNDESLKSPQLPGAVRRLQIRDAVYSARFTGTRLESGSLELSLIDNHRAVENRNEWDGPLLLGTTNLQRLQLSDETGQTALGADAQRRLYVLRPALPDTISGTFTAEGMVAGPVVSFRLELPPAITSRLELTTLAGIQVSSSGSLVTGPKRVTVTTENGEPENRWLWTLYPGDGSRLSFSCRTQNTESYQGPLPLSAFSSVHSLTGDVLTTRWTIGLPAALPGRFVLTARIPEQLRISEVQLEDNRLIEWTVTPENLQHQLRATIPESVAGTTLLVTGTTVLPQSSTWNLPVMSPSTWQGLDGTSRGTLLLPVSPINVILPPTVELDEWSLVGIQERDVITRPDQSREYQLMRYLPVASAMLRTTTSQPVLSDSVVTLVEPAGRLTTAQCAVQIRCESAAAVDIRWPVSPGWQVISVRDAADMRALFFEVTPERNGPDAKRGAANVRGTEDVPAGISGNAEPALSDQSTETGSGILPAHTSVLHGQTLTVHFPEPIDPGTQKTIEIQLQELDTPDLQTRALPIRMAPRVDRTASLVVFSPAYSLNSELIRRWGTGRRPLTADERDRKVPWFPRSRFSDGMQTFEARETPVSSASGAVPLTELREFSVTTQEHAVRIAGGRVIENSRITLPENVVPGSVSVLIPADVSGDIRWTVDGSPVSARRDQDADLHDDWIRWSIPLTNRRADLPVVIRLETQRPITDEFVASVPYLEHEVSQGKLLLNSSDDGVLSVKGLARSPETDRVGGSLTTAWLLPGVPVRIPVRIEANQRIQSGQTIDVQMLHLFQETEGKLQQDVLAVASVTRTAGQRTLPLSLEEAAQPVVLVNGRRVQLLATAGGFEIPLPSRAVGCQVLVVWRQPDASSGTDSGVRELPRLFLSEAGAPQCTHHILAHPDLTMSSPTSVFSASQPAEIASVLDRILMRSPSGFGELPSARMTSMPAEFRRFIIQWQVAVNQQWKPHTLIDFVAAETPVRIEVTQVRRSFAISTGSFLVMMSCCLGLRHWTVRYRLFLATTSLAVLGVSLILHIPMIAAALIGGFWGISIGLMLVILPRWEVIRNWNLRPLLQHFQRLRFSIRSLFWLTLLLFLSLGRMLPAQEAGVRNAESVQTKNPGPGSEAPTLRVPVDQRTDSRRSDAGPPEVLIPDPSPGGDVVYVRQSVLDTLRKPGGSAWTPASSAVITSLHSRILTESVESIEIELVLQVAAVSYRDSQIRLALQGTRFVDCTIDGVSTFPESEPGDAIRITVPAASVLPAQLLDDSIRSAVATEAGPRAAFTEHQIVCRLRPPLVRQASGIQFRLPTLPCPSASLEIVDPGERFSRARAQTAEGVVQWNPSEGVKILDRLTLSDSIDLRLFQAVTDPLESPPAALQLLAVHEIVAEQQFLNLICRFSKWNSLTPEVRFLVPDGYSLTTVSATTGADVTTDLLWSVKDRAAVVQLPAGVGSAFTLSLQLVGLTPASILEQSVPVSALQRFADCVVSPAMFLAVRANPVFSVLPPGGEQISTTNFSDVQQEWGPWLRRSDVVFRVPLRNTSCLVRLAPRSSVNEVRMSQENNIRQTENQWKCRIEIETSVLPVFRHRIQLHSDVAVTDVQVVAGEANRLASWQRRGDQLLIQLREGTTGLHGIALTGRQIIRPDDTNIALHSPHLLNAQILDSSMTVTDVDSVGLTFHRLGGAVPDALLQSNSQLPSAQPVRMQIVNETDPVILARVRPVQPLGTVAAVRSSDQVTFAVHLQQWSASMGPLQLRFPREAEFLQTPMIVTDRTMFPLQDIDGLFQPDQSALRELFERSDFTVLWTVPVRSQFVTPELSVRSPSSAALSSSSEDRDSAEPDETSVSMDPTESPETTDAENSESTIGNPETADEPVLPDADSSEFPHPETDPTDELPDTASGMPLLPSAAVDESADPRGAHASFSWPSIVDDLQWSEFVLIPADAPAGSEESLAAVRHAASSQAPGWLINAINFSGLGIDVGNVGFLELPVESVLSDRRLTIPVSAAEDQIVTQAARDVQAVSDSIIWSSHNQSPVGESTYILFSSRVPSRCLLEIPEGTVITELQSDAPTRWADVSRNSVVIEIQRAVTTVRVRWLSRRSSEPATDSRWQIRIPFLPDCQTHATLKMMAESGTPQLSADAVMIAPEDVERNFFVGIDSGLAHIRSIAISAAETEDPLPDPDTLVRILTDTRAEFASRFQQSGYSVGASLSCQLQTNGTLIDLTLNRRAELPLLLSILAGLSILSLSAFARGIDDPDGGMVGSETSASSAPIIDLPPTLVPMLDLSEQGSASGTSDSKDVRKTE